jgi:hypothetical protein
MVHGPSFLLGVCHSVRDPFSTFVKKMSMILRTCFPRNAAVIDGQRAYDDGLMATKADT